MKVKRTEYDAATGEYKEIYEEDLPSPEEPETPPEPTLEEKVQELQNNILNLQSVLISQKISGGGIKLTDSSGFPIRDFSMQGKTEQEENASIESPKEIINAGENGEIEVKVTGKNLFDISKYDKYDDTWTNTTYTTKILKLKPNTTYTMSCKRLVDKPKQYVIFNIVSGIKVGKGVSIQIKPDLSLNYFYGKGTFTTDETGEIKFNYYVDCPKEKYWFTEVIGDIQIELGSTQTAYDAYKEPQTIQLQLDRPLTKWDKIEKRDGVYGIVYKHRTVDDFATLVKDSEPIYGNTGEKFFSVVLKDATLNYNYDKVYSEVGLYKKNVQKLYVPKVMLSSFIVGVNDTDTIETAKEHMHYKVIYETDSEEFVPLPEETQTVLNALHTYYPTTVMSNSEDCEMEVEYVADTKNYIDNKISANVASIISQYQTNVANLLSLMPLSVQAGMVENDTNNILENVEVTK